MPPPTQPGRTGEHMVMEGRAARIAHARKLIVEALAILDSEQNFIAAAHLGHALDLLDAEHDPIPPPAKS